MTFLFAVAKRGEVYHLYRPETGVVCRRRSISMVSPNKPELPLCRLCQTLTEGERKRPRQHGGPGKGGLRYNNGIYIGEKYTEEYLRQELEEIGKIKDIFHPGSVHVGMACVWCDSEWVYLRSVGVAHPQGGIMDVFQVRCSTCSACGPYFNTKAEAILLWREGPAKYKTIISVLYPGDQTE